MLKDIIDQYPHLCSMLREFKKRYPSCRIIFTQDEDTRTCTFSILDSEGNTITTSSSTGPSLLQSAATSLENCFCSVSVFPPEAPAPWYLRLFPRKKEDEPRYTRAEWEAIRELESLE